jgi:hypothetical protein
LAAEFTLDGSVKVRVDGCSNTSTGKREFSHSLDFVTDANTTAAKDTFIGVSLKKKRSFVCRKCHWLPGIECLFDSILIDQVLEIAFSFFFAAGTDHRVVKKNELELEPSRFRDLWRMSHDLHSVSRRGETGWHELRFSFLLDHAETAGAKRNKPTVVAKRGNADASQLSSLENGLAFFDLDFNTINRQFDHLMIPYVS